MSASISPPDGSGAAGAPAGDGRARLGCLPSALEDTATAATAPVADGQVQAAVLVPILLAREPTLVLTRRRAELRRHGGEISFPGGRRDSGDATLIETALRESEEEIGLRREEVELIGALPATSTFVTNYAIHPFVGVIAGAGRWTLSPREVDAILELPLLRIARSRTTIELTRRGFTFETDAYVLDGHTIWGATARIVEELLRRAGGERGEAPQAPHRQTDAGVPTPARTAS
ncbi:MAG: NUDIX hydrolase [Solirubrobacteraceae bacterium]